MAFVAASAVALALVLGLVFSTYSFVRERQAHAGEMAARRIADEQRQKAESREREARHLLYVADMNLAQNSWDQNNIGHLRDLLNETGAFPERGFEWYYWQRQIHQASRTFRGNGSSIASAAFSPDGQRVAAGVWDTGLVWDVSSGKELLSLKGHSLHISSVAFSPDGQRIVTGGGDKKAMVWDAATPLNCLTTLRGKRIARSPA